jgi:hypothetical protein
MKIMATLSDISQEESASMKIIISLKQEEISC